MDQYATKMIKWLFQIVIILIVLLSGIFSREIHAQVNSLTTGLLAYYSFDEQEGEKVHDLSGNLNEGKLINGAAWLSEDPDRAAVYFDGINDSINAGSSLLYQLPGTELSVAFRMKITSLPGWTNIIMRRGQNVYPFSIQCRGDRKIAFLLNDGSRNSYLNGSRQLSQGTWHHVAVTYKAGDRRIYIDGTVDVSDTFNAVLDFSGRENIALGTTASGTYPFNGALDELVIYNRALSAGEVAALAAGEVPQGDTTPPQAPASLSAYSLSCSEVELVWEEASDNDRVVEYQIYRDREKIAETGLRLYRDAGLSANCEYTYEITARDASGNLSGFSPSSEVLTPRDTLPPDGYFYISNENNLNVTINSEIIDAETGMTWGALMSFSNDGSTWSPPEEYTPSRAWTLETVDQTLLYARYADPAGNWTGAITAPLPGGFTGDFVVFRDAPLSARIAWKSRPGTEEYVVLKNSIMGWEGSTRLTAGIQNSDGDFQGDTIIPVEKTEGLKPGDQVHFRSHREDYYVKTIIDSTHFELTSPVLNDYPQGTEVSLSGGWFKTYTAYEEVSRMTEAGNFIDRNLEEEKDYFYLMKYITPGGEESYSSPLQVKFLGNQLYYDAALGSNGGYAWKVSQQYADTWELIDGNENTRHAYMQCNMPEAREALPWGGVGAHRVSLAGRPEISFIEISQNNDPGRAQARELLFLYDDGGRQEVHLDTDFNLKIFTKGDYRVFRVPVMRKTSFVNIMIEEVNDPFLDQVSWNRISLYTADKIVHPVTTAADTSEVTIAVDFTRTQGQLPVSFGGSDVVDSLDGREYTWMIEGFKNARELYDFNRVCLSDYWPREYGVDRIKVGQLASDLSASSSQRQLQLTEPWEFWETARSSGTRLRVDDEFMGYSSFSGEWVNLISRGEDNSEIRFHAAGTPVYAYRSVGQIGRMRELLPEFRAIRYMDAYVSGLTNISPDPDPLNDDGTPNIFHVDINDPRRREVVTITVRKGEYQTGDVIRMGWEKFKILDVNESQPGQILLEARRGFDGTNQYYLQNNVLSTKDIYKLIDYEPYYTGYKNDPADETAYYWDNFETTMDKIIKEGKASPFLIIDGARYTTKNRGRVISLGSGEGGTNNLIVDEYTTGYPEHGLWYMVEEDNNPDPLVCERGNRYQYGRGQIHILTGDAEGKVFYVRAHTDNTISLVRDRESTDPVATAVHYVDLASEGVQPGDAFIITRYSASHASMTRRYWQYNADIAYMIIKYIRENYPQELTGKPVYYEFQNEPNLVEFFGTWNKMVYVECYNIFGNTFRTGGPHFPGAGFSKEDLVIGAGALAGGLNPGSPGAGARGDYDFALTLVEESDYLDYISHHRYYMGARVQKRENPYEYWMIRTYAESLGRDIRIIDSEDSVATAGGTGREEARHWARFCVPYWLSNFITSYSGSFGEKGQLDLLFQFRMFSRSHTWGLVASEDNSNNGKAVYDIVYWTLKMFREHTSRNPLLPDTIARTIRGSDTYGWVEAMGTIHGETGEKKIHLVNKKDTPIVISLELTAEENITSAYMDSCTGEGDHRTMSDGYHPLDYAGETGEGPVVRTILADPFHIILEPCSANIITFH